jgi:hypothetical protein
MPTYILILEPFYLLRDRNKMYEQSMYLHTCLICFLQSWNISDSEFNIVSSDSGWKSSYRFCPTLKCIIDADNILVL